MALLKQSTRQSNTLKKDETIESVKDLMFSIVARQMGRSGQIAGPVLLSLVEKYADRCEQAYKDCDVRTDLSSEELFQVAAVSIVRGMEDPYVLKTADISSFMSLEDSMFALGRALQSEEDNDGSLQGHC